MVLLLFVIYPRQCFIYQLTFLTLIIVKYHWSQKFLMINYKGNVLKYNSDGEITALTGTILSNGWIKSRSLKSNRVNKFIFILFYFITFQNFIFFSAAVIHNLFPMYCIWHISFFLASFSKKFMTFFKDWCKVISCLLMCDLNINVVYQVKFVFFDLKLQNCT